ncbi:hypothetical protein MJN54_36355, partial [Salmonella enterica subsp. enterica serovar Kentucky]|nr:hypothetical protein [Salmonella enterica subsp. enterica serovar Kentucky]
MFEYLSSLFWVGFSTETVHGPLLEDLSTSGIWLIISSTHGAGDIPDNLTPFYE